jgi:hypothetical protein
LSRKPEIEAVLHVEMEARWVRPLPSQQEEVMKARKTLFEYLLEQGASVRVKGDTW